MFLTDDRNTAVFPDEQGRFSPEVLMLGSHYEVKGSAIAAGVAAPYTQPAATPFTGQPGGRFAFATRAQPQQHQPQQPQQQQQPQPQPQFRRPVSVNPLCCIFLNIMSVSAPQRKTIY